MPGRPCGPGGPGRSGARKGARLGGPAAPRPPPPRPAPARGRGDSAPSGSQAAAGAWRAPSQVRGGVPAACAPPRPGPCLLLEVDGALHRAVALQHAHGLRRHASRGDARRPREPEDGEENEETHRTQRRKRRRKLRPRRRRRPFIRPSLATPILAPDQSPPAGSAHPPWSSCDAGHAGGRG